MEICSKSKCTGCFACYNICPVNCIKMVENEYGEIYPEINQNICRKCNKCKKICPQLNGKVFKNKPLKAFAMYSKDENIWKESTSGGAATTFYRHILENDGIIYGVNNLEKAQVNFVRIDKLEEVYKVQGSKYVHAYVNGIYKDVEKDLKSQKTVLFIGTPCQVDGLNSFLKKEYKNLITIDLICHGVPSQKLLKDEILTKISDIENIDKVTFREGGYRFILYSNNTKIIDEKIEENNYLTGFMEGLFLRENCYECVYANTERVSDITIGDFWGLANESQLHQFREEGVSVILVNTQKGLNLINECKSKMILEERSVEEAIVGNSQLRHPTIKHKKYKKFKKIYLEENFNIAFKKTRSIKQKLKNNKKIYNIYKGVKGR